MDLRKVRHEGINWFIRLFVAAVRPVPFGLLRPVCGAMGVVGYRLVFPERRKALEHLRMALGDEKSGKERDRIARNLFRNYGYCVAELLQFPKGEAFFGSIEVEVEGREHLDWLVEHGKGAVFVTAHAGNWEILAAWLSRRGYPVNVVAREARHSHAERILQSHRDAAGVRVFTKYRSARAMMAVLLRGEGLGILADVDTRGEGIFVDFFGLPAHTPTGPARLAAKTGAPLVVGFIARTGPRRHRIVVNPPVTVVDGKPPGGDEKDIPGAVRYYTREIERWVRRYPDQWVWTHRRWKRKPPPGTVQP
jgi:KDO2-lipid IV(A) lauroyltransferase